MGWSDKPGGVVFLLIRWLNEAGTSDGQKRAELLRKVSELLLHQLPHLLPTHIDNVLSYVGDRSADVKKQVITFIEQLSEKHPEHIPSTVSQLRMLLSDEVVAVQKRVVQAASLVYKRALVWICTGGGDPADLRHVWEQLTQLKVMNDFSEKHPEHIPSTVSQLRMLLSDEVVAVQKRVVQAASLVYKRALVWICTGGGDPADLRHVWEQLTQLKVMNDFSEKHPEHIPSTVSQLRMLLSDEVVAVQKRVVQAASLVYKRALVWICTGGGDPADLRHVWEQLTQLKVMNDFSEKHPEHIPSTVSQLRMLLSDEVVAVQKRVVQAASLVYKRALVWICTGGGDPADLRHVWEQLTQLKVMNDFSEKHPEHIPSTVSQLRMLLSDEVVAVQKRVVQAASLVYKRALVWICTGGGDPADLRHVWEQLTQLKVMNDFSEKHPEHIPSTVSQLRMLLSDEVVAVQKRVVQAASLVYKRALVWICTGGGDPADLRHVWEQLTQLKVMNDFSEKHPEHIPSTVSQLRMLLSDEVVAVQKRVVQAASLVYKRALVWICTGGGDPADLRHVWEQLTQLKLQILNMIDSDNEGIRTNSIKFLESIVILQSCSEGGDSEDFSLEDIPHTFTFIRRRALEEESEHIFQLLLKFHNSQHISSVNLMACMTALCSLAKFRPKYMPRVIQALGDLHTTLPPTLSQSQVNSVRKHLKMLLMNLIKHPSSNDMMPHLTQLLSDIGMTPQEIAKAVPKERRNKRVNELRNGEGPNKRQRVDSPQSNSQGSDRSDFMSADDSNEPKQMFPEANTVAETRPVVEAVTEDSIFEGLQNVDSVINLVMATLSNCLPEEVPNEFITKYKPIPNSGTNIQKRNLSKMLLVLLKCEPVVPPPTLSELTSKIPGLRDEEEKISFKNAVAKLNETEKLERQIEGAVSRLMEENRQDHLKEQQQQLQHQQAAKEKLVPPQTPTIPKLKHKVKMLKLQEVTRPIPKEIKEKLMLQAIERILRVDKEASYAGISNIRAKIITTFASSYTSETRDLILSYILDDAVNRIDLALGWLYEEYSFMQGFNRHPVTLPPKMNEKHDQHYNSLLCALIIQICERGDPTLEGARDLLLRKIYLEIPVVTEDAIEYLKHLACEENTSRVALELLEEIVVRRPPKANKYVTALLTHTINEMVEVREPATEAIVRIYSKCSESVRKVIEKYAKLYLGFIALNSPPMDLFNADSGRIGQKQVWSEGLYKICVNLMMAIFAVNEDMLLEIARVYGGCSAEGKRCVLRCAEPGVQGLRDGSEAVLRLLAECPRGAETLLARILHILTERSPPTPELVSRVRELYATRVSDVRFLIPVLNGLTKKEILAALPKLIKLNPVVVKEVFNKLLGLQNNNEEELPVSPAELLVALHLIDPEKADLKYVIKATALCFAENQTYTQDVVASVLSRLMEAEEIPVLMMRTVLQALTLYPGLVGLVLNIMQRLIEKEVWNNKVAWEGWIKCCERTTPASYTALLSLPAAPLAACLSSSPTLATKLASHVALLTPAQRAHLSPHARALAAPPQLVPAPHDQPAPLGVPPPDDYQEPGFTPEYALSAKPEPLPPGME